MGHTILDFNSAIRIPHSFNSVSRIKYSVSCFFVSLNCTIIGGGGEWKSNLISLILRKTIS